MSNAALTYFSQLWPDDIPAGQWLCIWTTPDKISHWVQSIEAAERVVSEQAGKDIYVSMGLTSKPLGPHARGGKDDITAIPGIWVDLDLKNETRAKGSLPVTLADLLKILPPDVKPTMTVASGGGLHVYWLFHQPLLITDQKSRPGDGSTDLVLRWQALLRRRAAQLGWSVDYTHDLSRVLRVAGTQNFKQPESPRLVTLQTSDGPRYDPSELLEIIEESEFADREAGLPMQRLSSSSGEGEGWRSVSILVAPNASTDLDLVEQLCQINPKFRATWNLDRPDIMHSGGLSEYDLALANVCLEAGMNHQETVNLLIHFRRMHNRPKARVDYYQRTIWTAMHKSVGRGQGQVRSALQLETSRPEPVMTDDSQEAPSWVTEPSLPEPSLPESSQELPAPGQRIEAATQKPMQPEPEQEALNPDVIHQPVLNFQGKMGVVLPGDGFAGKVDATSREDLLDKLSQWLGVKVLKVVKVSGSEPSYTLELENGKVHIESTQKLLEAGYMRARIASVTGMLIKRFKAPDWDLFTATILSCAELKDAGPEMDIEGEMIAILQQYLSSRPWLGREKASANESKLPQVKGDAITVNPSDIYMYVLREFASKITPRQIAMALVALGADSFRTRIAGVDQARWLLPTSLFTPSDYQKEIL